jgi:phosphoglycolate phosphatase-like HAD superfamily hydrolase
MFLRTAVGFDLDSTLCNTRHRWHLSPMADPESSWEKYCAARIGDTPIPGVVAAARLHYLYNQIHIWSGSESSSDQVTRRWLTRHRVPFDDLRQRPPGDDSPNAELKIRFIEELRAKGIETVLFFEDVPDVGRQIEEKTGVPVLVVNPCYPEDEEKFRRGTHDGRGGGL